jgi:ketosteroid isomerase-like protein
MIQHDIHEAAMIDQGNPEHLPAVMDAAFVANDAAALSELMAEEWVYVMPMGPVPRADIVGRVASGDLIHYGFETIGETRSVTHGDAFIHTARKVSSGSWEGADYRVDEWITQIWVRQTDGRWRCVLSHKNNAT